ncbi:MAG: DegT/DnrJ/EryC1/StrS aminotransferase family protein, partial [bacterium]|nr:DegT/DnrJ/EryC1/StrS aminotransferase family protein [bacterium]
EQFETALAAYFGVRHVVAVNSGTAALHLALAMLDLQPGDEVIVPTITFVSTAHVVEYCDAKVVFADVEEDTLCINCDDVRRKLTPQTRAILPVHYAGHPCDLEGLRDVIGKRDIFIVEDAAHACGAAYKGEIIGHLSPLTCFSFHAVKNLTCGEGGAVATDNDVWARRLKQMRWLGISKDTFTRTSDRVYAWQYWVNELGYKYHMHDISAAIGLVQLSRLDTNNQKRRAIVQRYNQAFASHSWIETPPEQEYAQSAWHIYHIKVPERDRLIAHLKQNGIAPGVHYYPIHMHPYYAAQNAQCPIAEQLWKRILSLPLFPDMSEEEIDRVVDTVISFEKSI